MINLLKASYSYTSTQILLEMGHGAMLSYHFLLLIKIYNILCVIVLAHDFVN